MVNQQAFIQSITNLTGEDFSKELAQFCRKWIEENSDKLSLNEADRILCSLNPTKYTLGSICIFIAKVQKLKNDQNLLEFLNNFQNILPSFDVKQLNWAPDIYNRLFENIADCLLKRNMPIWGITLLETAILTFTNGNPSQLTNLHATLFCLCLKAQHFAKAIPFMKVEVIELFKQSNSTSMNARNAGEKSNGVSSSENTSQQQQSGASITSSAVSLIQKAVSTMSGGLGMKTDEPKSAQPLFKRRSILLYFYYGAMIYGALKEWEEAVLFLEHLICLPTKKTSFIVVEGLKKFILMSLIIGRKKPLESLPGYRTPNIQRNLLSLVGVYMKVSNLIQRSINNKADVVVALTACLEDNRVVFDRDRNIGLMKVLINVTKENALKRLSNIFVSLQLGDVCRMAHLPISNSSAEEESLEQIILRLRRNNQLTAHIDGNTQTVVFEKKHESHSNAISAHSEMDIDTAMTQVFELSHTIRKFNNAIRLNPHFIEKNLQKMKERRPAGGNGGGGSGPHGSGSIFPEDEFFLTGSP